MIMAPFWLGVKGGGGGGGGRGGDGTCEGLMDKTTARSQFIHRKG